MSYHARDLPLTGDCENGSGRGSTGVGETFAEAVDAAVAIAKHRIRKSTMSRDITVRGLTIGQERQLLRAIRFLVEDGFTLRQTPTQEKSQKAALGKLRDAIERRSTRSAR